LPPQSGGPASYNPTPSVPTGAPDIVSVRGIKVARQIAAQVEALLAAATRDGVKLSGGGFRTSEQQINLRIAHCGGNTHYHIYEKPSSECTPPTAPPGRSNHEKGLAIDFTYNGQTIKSRSSPGFLWLAQNAAKYGLYNLPSEPWHWSVNGK
jgi:LAS superfamily LD-carboxypeptidase LdcB